MQVSGYLHLIGGFITGSDIDPNGPMIVDGNDIFSFGRRDYGAGPGHGNDA